MTTFVIDQSHYDTLPVTGRDGADGYTHKCTEGDHFYRDLEYQTAMVQARTAGFPILGSYHVLHHGNLSAQADWWVSEVNSRTPWWREWDSGAKRWIWQLDCEPFSYMTPPTIDEINAFGQMVCDRTGVATGRIAGYTAVWHYRAAVLDQLWWLWNANYGTNPVLPYRQAYAVWGGDNSSRWAVLAGRVDPVFSQYGSNTLWAGQTTVDASAFRGTLIQLFAVFDEGGDDMPTAEEVADAVWAKKLSAGGVEATAQGLQIDTYKAATSVDRVDLPALAADVAAIKMSQAAILSKLNELAAGGGSGGPVDLSDASLDAIEARVDKQLDEQSLGGADKDA